MGNSRNHKHSPKQACFRSTYRLRVADLDNNGGLDLVAGVDNDSRSPTFGDLIWLSKDDGNLPHQSSLAETASLTSPMLIADGRLDLLGLSLTGNRFPGNQSRFEKLSLASRSSARQSGKSATSASIRFGVGGEMEIRSGLHGPKTTDYRYHCFISVWVNRPARMWCASFGPTEQSAQSLK